jgi:hypothetical protein
MSNILIFSIRGFAIFAGGPAVIDLQAIDLHGANSAVCRSS